MRVYKKAILPIGFKASAAAAGIKKSGRLDLALFYSRLPAKAACLFTSNKIQAAPIKVDKAYLKNNREYRAIIANSGNANCFTGRQGIRDAEAVNKTLAGIMAVKKESILAASTGIIGRRLPLSKIIKALPGLVKGLSIGGISKAKEAIMTTDKFVKEITVKLKIGNYAVTLCGVAKGAGMIAPDMACPERSRGATMLCFVLTDANITERALSRALKIAVDNSFNCITVDGCMSTNDSVIALANAAAGNKPVDTGSNFNLFLEALSTICLELAKSIVKDAEGASKFIRIKVSRAKNYAEARQAALGIANSDLFKTAIYGENPNYGRIVAAVGASGIAVEEDDLKIKVSPLRKKEINVEVDVNRGESGAIVYTSDLTPEYIKINAQYN